MKIVVERQKCIGCGSCAAVCPKFFEMADDGLISFKGAKGAGGNFELEADEAGCIQEAAEICPAQIIKIEK